MSNDPSDASTSISRRRLIAGAGVAAGAVWVTPTVLSLDAAAAASGSFTTGLFKSGNGSANPALSTLCQNGAQSSAGRGTAVFKRTEGPATICVTVTLSTGADASSRDIFILQSNSSGTCVGGTVTPVGTWALSPAAGPQTFCAPIVSGATQFVIAQQLTGGGGNDGWSSSPPVSLP